jgi:hypothetical protein
MCNNNLFTSKPFRSLILIIIFTIISPSFSFALTAFQSTDDALLFASLYPNASFLNFGFNDISDVSTTNITSELTSTTNTVSANFIYTLDDDTYSGTGTWQSVETSTTLNISLHHNLSNGTNTIVYDYSSIGDLSNGVKDETVNATFGSASYTITKHTEETSTVTSKTTSMSGSVTINNESCDFSIQFVEEFLTSDSSQISIVSTSTPISPAGETTTLTAEYQIEYNQPGSVATFSTYDITVGGELIYTLNTSRSSTHAVTVTNDYYGNENLNMYLLHVADNNRNRHFQLSNTIQIPDTSISLYSLQATQQTVGFNWNNFCKEVTRTAAAGATTAGVATALGTDGGAPLTGPAAAGIGGLAAGAGGAVYYLVGWFWDWMSEPLATTCLMGICQNSSSSSTSTPTLSQWKQIFLIFTLLSLIVGFVKKKDLPNNESFRFYAKLPIGNCYYILFERLLYQKAFVWMFFTVLISTIFLKFVFSIFTFSDLIGITLCIPLVSYILHALILLFHDNYDSQYIVE